MNEYNGNGRIRAALVYISLAVGLVALAKGTLFSSGREMGQIEEHLKYNDERLNGLDHRMDIDEQRADPELRAMSQAVADDEQAISQMQYLIARLKQALGEKR